MKHFTLKTGIKRPKACKLVCFGETVWECKPEEFNMDILMNIIGEHSLKLYKTNVMSSETADEISITISDWDNLSDYLLLPVNVVGDENRQFIFRFDADICILESVIDMLNANNEDSLDLEQTSEQALDILTFTDLSTIINSVMKVSVLHIVYIYYKVAFFDRYNKLGYFKGNRKSEEVGESIKERIKSMLSYQLDRHLENKDISTIITVKFLDKILRAVYPEPVEEDLQEGSISMLWKIRCYVDGVHVAIYEYRIDITKELKIHN